MQMFTDIQRVIFGNDDLTKVVSVVGGSLDVYLISPNNTAYLAEQLAAPQAPLQITAKQLVTQGCYYEFRPGAGASYWING